MPAEVVCSLVSMLQLGYCVATQRIGSHRVGLS
jgi:hypothetical protein